MAVPRIRKPPTRFTGPASAYHPPDTSKYFSVEYFKLIDTASTKLDDCVHQEGAVAYGKLEVNLLSGSVNNSELDKYPELDIDTLKIQLAMFRQQFDYSSLDEAASVLRQQVSEVRSMFGQVECLIRLLLVIPVTSCEAERSFSSLRRLKTWLRNKMTQKRLNHVATCHVHKEYMDNLKLEDIGNSFIALNDRRLYLFGKF